MDISTRWCIVPSVKKTHFCLLCESTCHANVHSSLLDTSILACNMDNDMDSFIWLDIWCGKFLFDGLRLCWSPNMLTFWNALRPASIGPRRLHPSLMTWTASIHPRLNAGWALYSFLFCLHCLHCAAFTVQSDWDCGKETSASLSLLLIICFISLSH